MDVIVLTVRTVRLLLMKSIANGFHQYRLSPISFIANSILYIKNKFKRTHLILSEASKTSMKMALTSKRDMIHCEHQAKCMTSQEERRELIAKSGISKRISDWKPQVYCTCSSPIVKTSRFDRDHIAVYCYRCQLLIRMKAE